MKKMNMTLSVLLSVLLMLSAIPMGIAAQEVTVTSVTVDDLTVIEYSDGQQLSTTQGNTVIPLYWSYPVESTVTVTLSDGKSVTCNGDSGYYDIYRATGYWPQFHDDQSADNEWGIGDHTVPWTLGEFSGTYTVTVEETPVDSIRMDDVVVRENIDGYRNGHRDPDSGRWMSNTWFVYDTYTPTSMVTILYKSGPPMTLPVSALFGRTGYRMYFDAGQNYDNQLTLGEHTVTARFMGVETTYTLTVVDAIDRIAWQTLPTKQTYLYGETVDLNGGVVRVHFTDGTYEDVSLDNRMRTYSYEVKALSDTYDAVVTPENFETVGNTELSFQFLGETLTTDVTVKDIPSDLTLKVNDDRSLSLIASYDDGTADDTLNIRRFDSYGGGGSSDGTRDYRGYLVTDNGVFLAEMHEDINAGTLYANLGDKYTGKGIYATSNTVTDTGWFDAWRTINYGSDLYSGNVRFAVDNYHNDTDHFDGTVTVDNIDDILRITLFGLEGLNVVPGDTTDYVETDVWYANELVHTHFGIEIDATQSRFYDAEAGVIRISKNWSYTVYKGTTDITPTYKNGEWFIEIRRDKDNTFTVTLDDDMHITGFDFFTIGDVTGDDQINMIDIQKLFIGVSGGSSADFNTVAADINADGKNNMTDVMALYAQIAGRA